ncbi:MAG: hypothetical protein HKN20_11205, partial [Gemmatimonadetes bacterium]|nr:hypothetical protein [Gemmatimonadota bacterium]
DIDIATTPSVDRNSALLIAQNDINFGAPTDRLYYEELVILPVREEDGEERALRYKLAWRFDLDVMNPLGNWVTYVDAQNGEILWRYNMIHTLDITGNTQGDAHIYVGGCDPNTPATVMSHQDVVVTGVGTATSDANGDFTLPYGGTDDRAFTTSFDGPWIAIDRWTGAGADGSQAGTITPGTPLTIDWDDTNSIASERDLFHHINLQHDWLLDLDPTFTAMDYQAPCVVERTDGFCPGNAWYSFGDRSINFCEESATYGNTGQLADVGYHEYGHGITDQVYTSTSQPRSSLHEGNSDIAANLLTRESIIGLGFFTGNCVSGIRNSDNTLQYPGDWSDSHTGGQIIAGFLWDSWQELQNTLPQAEADSIAALGWHFARRLGLPQTEEDQVLWTFMAVDNDGDLTNGVPNYAAWCVGASNHNFSCPVIVTPVSIVHTPVTEHLNETLPIDITATITSDVAINVGATEVFYRVDGGSYTSVGVTANGGDSYTGQIPAQPIGSFVDYYIYAEDVNAASTTEPSLAPTNYHSFLVGTFVCSIADDFESPSGWVVNADSTDDATTGFWELGDPEGTTNGGALQPEDDHTVAGTDCWATQLAAGASGGTFDIDGGKTSLYSPVYDLSANTISIVSYWRWYTNNLGASPGADVWQVSVNDGGGWVDLENTTASANSWTEHTFLLNDFISLTSTVQFRFIASDEGDGSLVEAALDDFSICSASAPAVSGSNSTVSANTGLFISPDGNGDSTLTITVTARDGANNPMTGIAAGDVTVDIVGTSSVGEAIRFCASGTNTASFASTAATDVNGETVIQIANIAGCGNLAITATVSSVALAAGTNSFITSPDLNGDNMTNFMDTFIYLPELNAGTGTCGNFDRDPANDVNFFDTLKYLPLLFNNAQCP